MFVLWIFHALTSVEVRLSKNESLIGEKTFDYVNDSGHLCHLS